MFVALSQNLKWFARVIDFVLLFFFSVIQFKCLVIELHFYAWLYKIIIRRERYLKDSNATVHCYTVSLIILVQMRHLISPSVLQRHILMQIKISTIQMKDDD